MKSMILMVGISLLVVLGYYAGRNYYLKPRLVQGQKANEITGILLNGSPFTLSALKGKYVLLDYWGSWCGPCIQSHPALVGLYDRFHGQAFVDGENFEIVSIAVESNDRYWQKVIEQDHLRWPYHLSTLELFDSPMVKAYNVKQLPTRFLINPKGIIMGVDPSIGQVGNVLEKKLK